MVNHVRFGFLIFSLALCALCPVRALRAEPGEDLRWGGMRVNPDGTCDLYFIQARPGDNSQEAVYVSLKDYEALKSVVEKHREYSYYWVYSLDPDQLIVSPLDSKVLAKGIETLTDKLLNIAIGIHQETLSKKDVATKIHDLNKILESLDETLSKEDKDQITKEIIKEPLRVSFLTGFQHPLAARFFKLSQKERLAIEESAAELDRETVAKVEKLMNDYDDRILELLTPEQRDKWNSIVGERSEKQKTIIERWTKALLRL